MAKKTKTTRTKTTRTYVVPNIVRALSFVAVMLMGLGIAIGVVFGWLGSATINSIGGYVKSIAIAIGLIALCWYSYYYARYQGSTWFVLWIVAVVLIVVFYILGIALPNPISCK